MEINTACHENSTIQLILMIDALPWRWCRDDETILYVEIALPRRHID
jgi:hypothetical protein